jgi:hypothetical protein
MNKMQALVLSLLVRTVRAGGLEAMPGYPNTSVTRTFLGRLNFTL